MNNNTFMHIGEFEGIIEGVCGIYYNVWSNLFCGNALFKKVGKRYYMIDSYCTGLEMNFKEPKKYTEVKIIEKWFNEDDSIIEMEF